MTEPLTDERPDTAIRLGRIDVVRSAPAIPSPSLWPRRVAVGVWLLLLVGVFGRVLVQKAERQSVVPIYQTGGERWLTSEPLYPPIPSMDLYRNPPGVAALFAPLTFLPPKLLAIGWRAACVAVYLLGIRNLLRDVLPPLSGWRRAVVWMLAAVLVLPAFNNGQINLMIVAAALCGVAACARGHWWTAAAWLAFAGWFKVYPFAVGLLCVVVAPRQLGWRLAVTAGVLFGLPFLLQNPAYVWDRHAEFLAEMKLDDRTLPEVPLARVPRDWTILPRLWADVAVPRVGAQAVALAAAAGMAGVVLLSSRGKPAWVLPLLLGLIWMTLFGPGTEMNTYSVLAPVAGVLAVIRSRWMATLGWVGGGLLLANVVRAGFGSGGPFPLIEASPIAAALLLIAAAAWALGSHRGTTPQALPAG